MTTRIALLDLPGLLVDVVVEAFAREPDVVIDVLPSGSPPGRILAGRPDVVMVGVEAPWSYPPAEGLLCQHPGLGLFAISPDARQVWAHELRPSARALAEVSASGLRAAVSEAVSRRRP
ncbi:hypothetical protein I6A84_38885 [Frankia sp. CNm7]|uniref:Uncharacterized protein n=1 Tax=Frankia nepalensis TaxID=1836974 RepID=A0A937UTM2_9ACTN|nr:hypothetical protein [Frankia nepalensis]MBL7501503.1 hypothetical protein [Frankia nepalensis]MBL7513631.1 hypothetical protein [Frankia nepalensis]MBL7523852.1 hypothetical protein [Frankia nepalensis]MBL7633752.1 hypothetical protein [Frankia nepalensis]